MAYSRWVRVKFIYDVTANQPDYWFVGDAKYIERMIESTGVKVFAFVTR